MKIKGIAVLTVIAVAPSISFGSSCSEDEKFVTVTNPRSTLVFINGLFRMFNPSELSILKKDLKDHIGALARVASTSRPPDDVIKMGIDLEKTIGDLHYKLVDKYGVALNLICFPRDVRKRIGPLQPWASAALDRRTGEQDDPSVSDAKFKESRPDNSAGNAMRQESKSKSAR